MQKMPTPLRELLNTAHIKQIPKGQILFYAEDVPLEVLIVKEGIVKIHSIDDNGNEKVLHLVGVGAVLPLAFFSGENVATHWFYTTLTDCEVHTLSRASLQDVMREHSEVAVFLMNWFSSEVHELLVRLDSLGKTNVQDKLRAVLMFLAVRHGVKKRGGWYRVSFPVNHQLLADMIGMTRESTAMAMKEFADEKIIRNPRLAVLEMHTERLTG
jgi:CRP/FNR family transcriptional regulator, anaerobic regulatory protein